jgi:hypothetical protein
MDSILVIFYSYTGISRRLAQLACAQQGWAMGEVRESQPRSGALGFARCLWDSLLLRHPAVTYEGPDPGDFRTVVIVAPIWAGELASPMRSFIAANQERLHRVAVLLTMGGRGGTKATAEIARLVGAEPILAASITAREVEDGSCAQTVEAFGSWLRPKRTVEPVRAATWSPQAG